MCSCRWQVFAKKTIQRQPWTTRHRQGENPTCLLPTRRLGRLNKKKMRFLLEGEVPGVIFSPWLKNLSYRKSSVVSELASSCPFLCKILIPDPAKNGIKMLIPIPWHVLRDSNPLIHNLIPLFYSERYDPAPTYLDFSCKFSIIETFVFLH